VTPSRKRRHGAEGQQQEEDGGEGGSGVDAGLHAGPPGNHGTPMFCQVHTRWIPARLVLMVRRMQLMHTAIKKVDAGMSTRGTTDNAATDSPHNGAMFPPSRAM
jgi:hypothetical protein